MKKYLIFITLLLLIVIAVLLVFIYRQEEGEELVVENKIDQVQTNEEEIKTDINSDADVNTNLDQSILDIEEVINELNTLDDFSEFETPEL